MHTTKTARHTLLLASFLALVFVLVFQAVNTFLAVRSPVSAAGETLTIGAPVVFSSSYSISSAQFIDSANSAYYLTPAATGTSLVTAGDATVSGTITLGNAKALRSAFGPLSLQYKSGLNAWTTGLTIQDTTGNVGIGSTAPAQKLSVAGTIESTTGGLKFPDGTTQTTAATGVPSGLIAFFASACPTGWTEYTAARGRVIVGVPLSGTVTGTVGTAYTNLEDRTHLHTIPNHTHTVQTSWGGDTRPGMVSGVDAGGAGNSGNTSATPPYIQLTACQKN